MSQPILLIQTLVNPSKNVFLQHYRLQLHSPSISFVISKMKQMKWLKSEFPRLLLYSLIWYLKQMVKRWTKALSYRKAFSRLTNGLSGTKRYGC